MLETVCEWCVNLSAPVILLVSGLYAGVSHWRGRRARARGVRPAGVPAVFDPRAEMRAVVERGRLAAEQAELIVAAEADRVGFLYVAPSGEQPTR